MLPDMTSVIAAANHPAFKQSVPAMGKGLGRLPAIDFRDRGYLLRRPASYVPTRKTRYWHSGGVLDQGNEPHCVAFAGEAYLVAGPVKNKPWQTPADLYHQCQLNDEWEGEDYDGTSVRALMKVLQREGLIGEYQWAFDAATALHHVLETGPIIFGTDWMDGMFTTDSRGFIRAALDLAGGHAYEGIGASTVIKCPDGSTGAFRIQNSWGRGWGQSGRCWLSFADADMLIKRYGECACAQELKFEERAPEGMEAALNASAAAQEPMDYGI